MKLSLRWKFVIAFTLVPMLSLGIYFYLIYKNFKTDRLASIFETSLTQSRLLSKVTSEKISPIVSLIEQWATFYYRDPNYAETLLRTMRESSSNLKIVSSAVLIDYDPDRRQIINKSKIQWSPEGINLDQFINDIDSYRERLDKSKKPLLSEKVHPTDWTLIQRFKRDHNREIIVLISFTKRWVFGRFAGQVVTNNYWIGDQGQILAKNSLLPDEIVKPILKTIVVGKSTYGSFQFKYNTEEYIVSYTVPNQAQLVMINLIKASSAYEALNVIRDQSLLLLGIFICISMILGVLLSHHLTQALEILTRATASLGKGTFKLKLNIKTGDEIEQLGKSIVKMANDIQKLVDETKHLGRMESELLLAKEVQTTLFPLDSYSSEDISLRAFTKSASESGGDWWTYFESEEDFFIIIGDATGHGVPAALLTSAINSITYLLRNLKVLSPKEMLSYMNQSLHQTTQGKKSMTMSLLKIHKKTGMVKFANASHESPLILRNINQQTRLNELISLDVDKSNPLGFIEASHYDEGEFQLNPNDTILLYTDGAIDARNKEDKAWGERRFSKAIIEGLVSQPGLDRSFQQFRNSFDTFTKDKPLIDDVTVIILKYKSDAA